MDTRKVVSAQGFLEHVARACELNERVDGRKDGPFFLKDLEIENRLDFSFNKIRLLDAESSLRLDNCLFRKECAIFGGRKEKGGAARLIITNCSGPELHASYLSWIHFSECRIGLLSVVHFNKQGVIHLKSLTCDSVSLSGGARTASDLGLDVSAKRFECCLDPDSVTPGEGAVPRISERITVDSLAWARYLQFACPNTPIHYRGNVRDLVSV